MSETHERGDKLDKLPRAKNAKPGAKPDSHAASVLRTLIAPSGRTGRPRTIQAPEDMLTYAEEYLDACVQAEAPITYTGLILFMGLSSRDGFDGYLSRGADFAHAVKRCKLLIEYAYEYLLLTRERPTGAIFALKQMGWRDEKSLNVSGFMARINFQQLPAELLARIADGEDPRAVLASLGPGPQAQPFGLLPRNTPVTDAVSDGEAEPND